MKNQRIKGKNKKKIADLLSFPNQPSAEGLAKKLRWPKPKPKAKKLRPLAKAEGFLPPLIISSTYVLGKRKKMYSRLKKPLEENWQMANNLTYVRSKS